MTNEELKSLFETSMKRSEAIQAKYRGGEKLTRRDCLELRVCTDRIFLVAKELWLASGQPAGPEFDCLRQPPPHRALPFGNTREMTGGGH